MKPLHYIEPIALEPNVDQYNYVSWGQTFNSFQNKKIGDLSLVKIHGTEVVRHGQG